MPYALATRELTEPLGEIRLGPEERGLALLVRIEGRPVAFILKELGPSTVLSGAEVDRLIAGGASYEILSDSVRRELADDDSATPAPDGLSLTVAVCTRARTELLEPCLRSVLSLTKEAPVGGFEVLVVDNAPPDDATRVLVASMDGVRYATEPRPGLDFARNRALVEATGDYVAFLDDDVEVDEGWLAGLGEALVENPDAAAVTGLVLPYELRTDAQIRFEQRGGFRRGFTKRRYRGPVLPGNDLYPAGSGMFGAGCNMVLHRETVLDLGGFDEALDTGPPLPGGGDLDIFFRVAQAGKALVYEPRMLVFHKHRREHEQLRRQYWTWGTGLMAYLGKTSATEPQERPKLWDLRRWWVLNELRLLKQSVKERKQTPVDLVLAELFGGIVGVAGTYSRSRRRIEKIKRDHR